MLSSNKQRKDTNDAVNVSSLPAHNAVNHLLLRTCSQCRKHITLVTLTRNNEDGVLLSTSVHQPRSSSSSDQF